MGQKKDIGSALVSKSRSKLGELTPMSSPAPTNEDLLAAVRVLWLDSSHPPGIKKLVSSLRESHPQWEPHINGKTVRAAVKTCEEETGVSNKTAGDTQQGAGNNSGGKSGEGGQVDGERLLLAHAQTLRDWMATHPWPRPLPRKDILYSPLMMKAHLIGHIVLPATAENPPQGTSAVMRKVYLAFHLFYLEWDCFMGPDPTAPLPPATPDFPNYEAMAFVSLFPYGVGHYVGPEKQNGLTFDRYALNRLKLADPRFRQSAEWLTWALTRTADPELAKAINCMLVTLHKQKAWHLGKGQVQVLSLNDMFV